MCFAAEADIVAGVVVTLVGIDTMRHVGHDREMAMAAMPVVFGVHQIIEIPVWLGLQDHVSHAIAQGAAWIYLAIAFGVIPVLVPFAVRRLETDPRRRALMSRFVYLGVAVAVSLTVPLLIGPITFSDGGNHIAYSVPLVFGGLLTILYVAAVCGSLLMSTDKVVAIYGAVNLAVVIPLAVLLATGVISLWCVLAAVSSIAIAIHLRGLHRLHDAASATTAA